MTARRPLVLVDGISGELPSADTLNFGGQLAFPATQVPSSDANTLDDYEEGTFTPTLTFGGGSTGLTYAVGGQLGRYTKIGRLVIGDVRLFLTAKGSSTGAAKINGLPFTSAANPTTSGVVVGSGFSSTHMPLFIVDQSNTTITLTSYLDTAGNIGNMLDTNFTDTTQIRLSFAYTVA